MKRTQRLTLTLLAVLLPLLPTGLAAQVQEAEPSRPSPASVLNMIRSLEETDVSGGVDANHQAVAVLRQTLGRRAPAELDAFARDLVDLIRESPAWRARAAYSALFASATVYEDSPDRGRPYAGAVDAFIVLYESYNDPTGREATSALYGVFHTGGIQYVRDLYDASERPPDCQYPSQTMIEGPDGTMVWETEEDLANPCPNKSTWCSSGGLLAMNTDEGPDLEDWEWLCTRKRF